MESIREEEPHFWTTTITGNRKKEESYPYIYLKPILVLYAVVCLFFRLLILNAKEIIYIYLC